MYSWDDDMSSWKNRSAYRYRSDNQDRRRRDAAAAGERSYGRRSAPDMDVVSPVPERESGSKNPLIIGVDVTSSMASWPYEIFDRLPLLYNTLSQYRQDLEISFVAIGDARAFKYPLQASGFGRGAELEKVLKSIFPEGAVKGSIDDPESYGLFAYWVNSRVRVPQCDEKPFVIIFGDITMHATHTANEIGGIFGGQILEDVDCISEWQALARRWNTWFLRHPKCWYPEATDAQWSEAVGSEKIVHIRDQQRAVDYAMGLIASAWGEFDDFKQNMKARQSEEKVAELEEQLLGP